MLNRVSEFLSPISLQVGGGVDAPGLARRGVLRGLGDALPSGLVDVVGLLVSELVTNSVRHARAGGGRIEVEASVRAGWLRLTVSDCGGDSVPHVMRPDLERAGGLGLFLVETMSSSWGVQRESNGIVRVWCEIPLEGGDRPAGLV